MESRSRSQLAVDVVGGPIPVALTVVDRRLRVGDDKKAERVLDQDVLALVRNRVAAEIGRRSFAVGEGEAMLVELLEFSWDWVRVQLMGLVARADAGFRMRVSFRGQTAIFHGERSRQESSALQLIADQLELAMDDAMRSLGEWSGLAPPTGP
ncbi:MAG: hypothetical protein JNM17_39075 [Archangium sp.]|nr:hypothetical protein [Archangium sp.]